MASSSGNFLIKFQYRALGEAWILISWAREIKALLRLFAERKKKQKKGPERKRMKGK